MRRRKRRVWKAESLQDKIRSDTRSVLHKIFMPKSEPRVHHHSGSIRLQRSPGGHRRYHYDQLGGVNGPGSGDIAAGVASLGRR